MPRPGNRLLIALLAFTAGFAPAGVGAMELGVPEISIDPAGPPLDPQPGVAAANELFPSPRGKDYLVYVFIQGELLIDCWRFGADGSFSSGFGAGEWNLLLLGLQYSLWSGFTGGGLVGSYFSGATFPGNGRNIAVGGIWVVDPFAYPFTGIGVEVPVCVVSDSVASASE